MADFGLSVLTERHHAENLLDHALPTELAPEDVERTSNGPMILILRRGLPNRAESTLTKSVLRRGRRAYFYWPDENAIEVVTNERMQSFWRHRAVMRLYGLRVAHAERRANRQAIRRAREMAREVAAQARRAANPARPPAREPSRSSAREPASTAARSPTRLDRLTNALAVENGNYSVNGRGLYIRLDYWAKLTGGGSYGHTCYQAKALHKSCRDGLVCVTASRFALLDDFAIPQITIPARSHFADEYSLVHNAAAYEGVLEELVRLYEPTFVFERAVLGNRATSRICRRLGVPHIVEFNGSELTMSKVFGGREMENAATLQEIETETFREADVVCAVSDPVKDSIVSQGINPEKVLVNPNGVDLDAYRPLPSAERIALRASLGFDEGNVVVGFCGTFGGWHGIEVLAEAMPRILSERADARFLLIGAGNFKHLVTEAIEAHGIASRVVDVGMVPQQAAARLLAACDVLLSPHSKNMGDKPFFGSPTKLFEYMAYGVGIVCSDLVQLGEVMRPALTLDKRSAGFDPGLARSVLVTPASVDELVAATIWLIDEPTLREALGRNAQAAARAYYSWNVHVQSLWRFAAGEEPIGYHEDRGIA